MIPPCFKFLNGNKHANIQKFYNFLKIAVRLRFKAPLHNYKKWANRFSLLGTHMQSVY